MEHVPELVMVPRFTEAQIEALADPAFAVDQDGTIVAWNAAATDLLGWRHRAAIGTPCAALLQGRSTDGRECTIGCPRGAGQTCAGVNCNAHPNLRVHAHDGTAVDVTVVELPVLLGDQPTHLHILRPVIDFQRDSLTGLPGRHEVGQALIAAQSSARRSGEPLSAALLDLDRLKRINDRFGHAAGDAALRHVADTLREGRRHDHVARWGGDEFLLLAVGATPEATVTRLDRCNAALHKIRIAPRATPLSVSAGVTEVHPEDDLEGVVARADAALYEAKQQRATVRIAPSHQAVVAS
jgi:diguanylate cyclase (GGDEF)-like protein